MADLIDSAAGELQQAGSQLTRAGVQTTVKIAAAATRITAKVGARAVGGTIHALIALLDAAREATRSRAQEGEVKLRQFTRVTDGKREVVPIKDTEVARQLSRELRRHGVTFAVEKNADGSRTFHVQGKDATLIEHALTSAAVRVDERITRTQQRTGSVSQEPADVSLTQAPGTRVLELDDSQKSMLVATLSEAGAAPGAQELSRQLEHDSTVTLSEQNVATIDQALNSTPELSRHMEGVAAAISEEKVAIATVDLPDNPYLRDDLPAQEIPVELTQPGPDTAERRVPVTGERTATQKPSMRDATRERVARRIDVKVSGMKQQDAAAQAAKVATHDPSRNPTVRR